MRSQDNQRLKGDGMSHDVYDNVDDVLDNVFVHVRLPNDDPKKWKELSGECKIIKPANKEGNK